MNFLSLIVYIPLQIMFVPLALIGMCWVAYRQIGISKNLGVSQTAIEIVNARWTMQDVRGHAPPGSVLLADIYAARFTNMAKQSAVKETLDYTGQGVNFNLPFADNPAGLLAEFV
jgi:hypothetical protein